VAVAEPTVTGRLIAAWPSFALIGSYELLMRHVRGAAAASPRQCPKRSGHWRPLEPARAQDAAARPKLTRTGKRLAGSDLQRQAWDWAVANRAPHGSLPSGRPSPAGSVGTSGGADWSSSSASWSGI
jgi:hypothetical protein